MKINMNGASDSGKTSISIPFLIGSSSCAYRRKNGVMAVDYVVPSELENIFGTDEFDVCFDGNVFTFDAINMILHDGERKEISRIQYEAVLNDGEQIKFWKACERYGHPKASSSFAESISV